MAGIRKVKARAGQIKTVTNEEAETLFEDKAIPEIKVDLANPSTINLPPIPIVVGERSKFISHRLGYYPNIGIRQEDGVITQVGVNHISDQECEITWQGDLTGVVIIDY
jgi:hypothetical protein